MKLLFELSGEHPALPKEEIGCIGSLITHSTQVAIAECPDPADAERLAMTHVVCEFLGSCPAEPEELLKLFRDLSLSTSKPFAGRAKKMNDSKMPLSQLEIEKLIGSSIDGQVSLSSPEEEYRVICADSECFLGRVILRVNRGDFQFRNPKRRAFFHPGVMLPIYARALVNISNIQKGELMCDPFCGTGGILLEARLLGARVLGCDMNRYMISGAACNIPGSDIIRSDAAHLPIAGKSVDAVVTDLPYGQSVKVMASNLEELYDMSLAEIRRILKDDHRAVVVTHRDAGGIAQKHFSDIRIFTQRVHKSLTRRIMVLE